jgi:malonate-semialdehyde dehydrogenase (acetylating) / methylmalonate-semialdehyde dehydrogenase
MSSTAAVPAKPNTVSHLIGGRLERSTTDRWADVFNPSTGHVQARVPMGTVAEVDRAVRAAAAAFPVWSETPAVERARVMFRFRQLLHENFEELAALVTREHGKTLSEARAEMQRGIEMVEFACGIPSLLMGQSLENIASQVDSETTRHPVGVCVGITPFNFPSMVPLWMFPVAITCGNAFVLKPSEKVPLSAVRLGELLNDAGLPAGVMNVIHGDKAVVDALLVHPMVRAVSFVGSTHVARHIYEVGTANGKRVQAAGGAKNHIIVMPDADLDQAVQALRASAFGCAGERCMAGSVAVPVGNIADDVVEGLVRVGQQIKVGATDDGADVDMGPLITRDHRDRVAKYLDVASGEGASVVLDGRTRQLPADGFLLGPSVVDYVKPEMRLAREEVFGPVLSVVRAGDLDEALAIGRQCDYGNGASLFTRSGWAARQFKRHFNAGMIGINVGVPAPMAWFPFTGWNKSFYGDLHMQGTEGIQFYTQQKTTMSRWFRSATESAADPIWKTSARGEQK